MLTKSAKPRTNDASLCRTKGWKVGDHLRVDPTERSGIGFAYIVRITAIGEESILVRRCLYDRFEPERRWCRHLLDYVITKTDYTTAAELRREKEC